MKIINNFLPDQDFKVIQKELCSPNFPWYFNDEVVDEDKYNLNKNHFQFTHTFYADNMPTQSFFLLKPVIDKINPFSIIRIKANLTTQMEHIIEHGFHTDFKNENSKITTAIYYINNNNGYTKFQDNTGVESKENRFVEFDSSSFHTGTNCTDEKRRIVINFNYIK